MYTCDILLIKGRTYRNKCLKGRILLYTLPKVLYSQQLLTHGHSFAMINTAIVNNMHVLYYM